jgi:hypothetical protein
MDLFLQCFLGGTRKITTGKTTMATSEHMTGANYEQYNLISGNRTAGERKIVTAVV